MTERDFARNDSSYDSNSLINKEGLKNKQAVDEIINGGYLKTQEASFDQDYQKFCRSLKNLNKKYHSSGRPKPNPEKDRDYVQ